MNNIKIGIKLIGGFVLVALIAAGMTIFGIMNLKMLAQKDTILFNQGVAPFEHVVQLSTNFQRVRVNYRDMMIAPDLKKKEYYGDRTEKLLDTVYHDLEKYSATLLTEKGKKTVNDLERNLNEFKDNVTKLKELVINSKVAEAQEFMTSEMSKSSRAVQDQITVVANTKLEASKEISDENTATANKVSTTLIGILVSGVLIALTIGIFLTFSITGPLRKGVAMMQEMAIGHLGVRLNLTRKDEIGILAKSMDEFSEDLQKNVVGTIVKIGDGDLSTDLAPKDNHDEITPAVVRTTKALRGLIAEANMLSKAAVEGKLATRGNASNFNGGYKDIVQGVNSCLDAVIGPLNVAAEYVDRISKGDIPKKITDNYNGDFNEIKNNLNQCVDAVNQLVTDAKMLAQAGVDGQLATRADTDKHNGDFRKIVEGFNGTLDAVITPINEAQSVLEKVAARDLTVRVHGEYKGDMAKIKTAINSAVENLDKALQQVTEATEQVTSAGGQISSGSQSLAQGANEQASSLEEVSSSLEEMASMTKQNADNANQAKGLAAESDTNAKSGSEAMDRMSSAINRIKESSDQTAKIVKTIDEIAMQTNLLALNAAVEAARAGEAGRGFAVVAEEVRNLAQRSAQAAKNTADMITESVKNADDGVKIATEVSQSFETIAGSAKKVNDLIAEIAAASQEQSSGIEQINTAVAQMDKVTQQNAANSEESASAAEELSSQAEELKNMISQFALSHTMMSSSTPRRVAAATHTVVHAPVKEKSSYKAIGKKPMGKSTSIRPEDIIPLDDEALKEF